MTIKQFRTQFIQDLLPLYEQSEAESIFYLALQHCNQLSRVDLALQPDVTFSQEAIVHWKNILDQLKNEVPIQYLLGQTHFFGLSIAVNPAVLIPRPETEELVQWIIDETNYKENQGVLIQGSKILDIGTGSGCIAISLAKNIPNSQVFAWDVCENALAIAKKNAKDNDVTIGFLLKNILQVTALDEKFDCIVSNPPYVRELEKKDMKKNVMEYEPHLALFVDDHDALVFYRKIATLARDYLNDKGQLFFEINQYLALEMNQLLLDIGFKNIEIRKDIYGNDRMIRATIK